MGYKTHLALSIVIGGLVILASPVEAQVKKSTAGRAASERVAPAPEGKAPKSQAFEMKAEGTRAKDQADDIWIASSGGFHMSGNTGRAIYVFPPGSGKGDDTTWRFVDDIPVSNRVGWTYKEDGNGFYMFYPMNPASNGRYELMYSYDNEHFTHYDWAD